MKYFPIFLSVESREIAVSGGGEAAVAKLRLLLKTEARITVFADEPAAEVMAWAGDGRLDLVHRPFSGNDAPSAALIYAANDDDAEDARVVAIARARGTLVNSVDNLDRSDFITPAIVDRDPVTVAIGTEGAAPVLARSIKAHLEAYLSPAVGVLARAGQAFRDRATALPFGRARRDFWNAWYARIGPAAADAGEPLDTALSRLLDDHLAGHDATGRVAFVGAGPGDPDLLTLKARKALDEADVVIHDRLISPAILELARREATLIDAGKEGFGPSMTQADINALIIDHARAGAFVVRLKSGDPTVYGRLDDELDAVSAAGVEWSVVPGITAASAAVATIGQSLTRRNRNSSVRLLTGHDMKGFAEHDWAALARAGEVAAIYMGKRSARFVQGRLLMHGADPATPVTIVENASRPDQSILATTLASLEPSLTHAGPRGPALILFGLAPRKAVEALSEIPLKEIAK